MYRAHTELKSDPVLENFLVLRRRHFKNRRRKLQHTFYAVARLTGLALEAGEIEMGSGKPDLIGNTQSRIPFRQMNGETVDA